MFKEHNSNLHRWWKCQCTERCKDSCVISWQHRGPLWFAYCLQSYQIFAFAGKNLQSDSQRKMKICTQQSNSFINTYIMKCNLRKHLYSASLEEKSVLLSTGEVHFQEFHKKWHPLKQFCFTFYLIQIFLNKTDEGT